MYINCHSYHSLRYGTLSVNDLVSQAQACNVRVLALTDINTVTGIYHFAKACKQAHIKPIVGMEFRSHNRLLYIGLAKNNAGIGEMCRLLTAHNCDGAQLPQKAPEFENVYVIYPFSNRPKTLRHNEFIGVRLKQLNFLIQKEWQEYLPKMVIWSPVTVSGKNEHNLHRILRAI
ncbi:DNA polymerase-3 subunit alpha, partial [Paenimyroides ummariense]